MKKPVIFGYHAVMSIIESKPECIEQLAIQKGRHDERVKRLLAQAETAGVTATRLSKSEIDAFAKGNHQGFALICSELPQYSDNDLWVLCEKEATPLFLILDGVQDPHNLGACLRTADAMGVSAVIIPKDRAVGLTPSVQKVACGAAFTTPLIPVTNLARSLRGLQERGVWLVGLDAHTEDHLHDIGLTGPIALVMGSEGDGLRRLTKQTCDYLAKIPMWGTVESMNVSVSTGIALYEANRQRHL